MKRFIAVSSVIYKGKLISLCTSHGKRFTNEKGIAFDEAMEFLFNLRFTNKRESGNVFVCFAFSRDNEFIFSSLPNDVKDKLFQSYSIKQKIEEIEYDQEKLDYDFWHTVPETPEHEQIDLERYINKLALKDIIEVKYKGYDISLQNGKRLVIRKNGKQFTLYDTYSFFRCSLYDAVSKWLKRDVSLLRFNPNKQDFTIHSINQLNGYCFLEAQFVAELADNLNNELIKNGIHLSRFHGTGAIASWVLGSSKAKREYHNYRHIRQHSNELHKAGMQSYYGGRAEQFKIGTFTNPVYVYDINSAYAFAASLLPVFLNKPRGTKEWSDDLFSIWFCEYDFTGRDSLYFGLLPNREKRTGFTTYKLKGKGYFWQPEVSFILKHFPECITVRSGFTIDYQQAEFTKRIIEIYEIRRQLQKIRHPLEKVLKTALATIYGKFCQKHGKGHYYNIYYAGFITSFVRAQLLEATLGQEEKVICFLTDAIHTTEKLDHIPISDELGEYKKTTYPKALYLDNGIYRLTRKDGTRKEATRGFRTFDFDLALNDLQNTKTYTGLTELFVGHNLSSFLPLQYVHKYLSVHNEPKKTNPFEAFAREFDKLDFDLTNEWVDSRMLEKFNGLESGLFQKRYYRETDLAKDTIEARRI